MINIEWQFLSEEYKHIKDLVIGFLLGAVAILPIWNYFEKRQLRIYDLESELDCAQYELDQILGEREKEKLEIESCSDFPSKETEDLLTRLDEKYRTRKGIAEVKIRRAKNHLNYHRKWYLWVFNKYEKKDS